MKKKIQICGCINCVEFTSDAAAIVLLFKEADALPLSLNLLLLDYEMVESVVVIAHEGNKKNIVLSITTEQASIDTPIEDTSVSIRLTRNDIQAILSFLLQNYRDGYWAVNHIDIELANRKKAAHPMTLIVQTDQPPKTISSEEARRLLGVE